jgi:lipopolysaccharide export system ATP-binding protein
VKPTEGRLKINGKDITRLKPHQRAKQGLVYLPQESSVFRKLSVEDNIRAIAETLKISRSHREELV